MPHQSTKTYGHEIGLSACFRQHRAASHCRFLHGYALAVSFKFEGYLDANNWVVDFGALKPLKAMLEELFDHKLLVAEDDPQKEELMKLQELGLAQVRLVPHVGCERFAHHVFCLTEEWLHKQPAFTRRVRLVSVEVREHGANSAIFTR